MTSMHVELTVHTDYLVGSDARRLLSSRIRFPGTILPLRELIRSKVWQEIHAFNERQSSSYGAEFLPADEYAEVAREGKELLGDRVKKGKANPNTELRLAMQALREKKFKVIIDGVEYSNPSSEITLNEKSNVLFIRLIPIEV